MHFYSRASLFFAVAMFCFSLIAQQDQAVATNFAIHREEPPEKARVNLLFSPDQVARLWGWWDAGAGVSVAKGKVAQWDDQSGNNRHWIQVMDSHRPRYIPIAQGDRPAIEWPRYTDVWLELRHFINPGESDIEAFVVARSTPDMVSAPLLQQQNKPGVGRAWLYFDGPDITSYIGGKALTASGAVDVFNVNIFHVSYDLSSQTLEVFKNGASLDVENNVIAEWCEGGLFLGRKNIGREFEGYVYEVIIFDEVMTSIERTMVVDYLKNKWKSVWPTESSRPDQIDDLWAWWRADAGVNLGWGGILSIFRSGGIFRSVESWDDQSGNGLTLVQPEVERRPQITENARNGMPGITFDNENDHLETLRDTLDFAREDATIFVAMNTEDIGDAAPIGGLDGATGIGRAWFENEPNSGRVYIGGFPAPLSLEGGRVIGPAILTVFYDGTRNVTQYAVNQWIWGTATDVIGEPNADGGTRVGDSKSDLNDFNGDIYEIAVFNRALSWRERVRVVNYLNDRWNVFTN